ncbi:MULTISPECIES: FMN-binding negative transcriptional regulator [Gammaproteobacteria]|uniref:FMN-binding negative transcriptional regulator n=1 Tax=Gammaproteobacteria TaxID=1236 RepID=UPI001ADAD35F|nr:MULTISPECIES: FMN-binding negative transcriptional regulator [Gammaproteobacteria]MBO9484578.1 FMN-binding negative transcriptional regulator [Salinisphaera sp. G21_0]MBO9494276.1 FMN-binding negative transcriptional regulator [Thalassotalea sp. G20_0]
MHIPSKFKEENLDKLHGFIQEYPLGTLIVSAENTLDADHIPFYLQKRENEVKLQSHIAKANPLWKKVADGQEVLLIFHGPNAYISPNFYPSKKETGKTVPTWNYSVVHVRGKVFFKHESNWILQLLNQISDFHELNQKLPWSVSDAPAKFTEKMLNAVVGLDVVIDDIVGNFKLSQNKTETDYSGVVNGLVSSEKNSDNSVANQMQQSTRS